MNTRLAPSRSAASATALAAGWPNTTRSIPVKTISPARMGSEVIGWPCGGEGERSRHRSPAAPCAGDLCLVPSDGLPLIAVSFAYAFGAEGGQFMLFGEDVGVEV